MKNITKKSIALLMAIAMIISCTAAVSAAEVEVENSNLPADAQVACLSVDNAVEATSTRVTREVCFSNGVVSGTVGYPQCIIYNDTYTGIVIKSNAEVLVRFYYEDTGRPNNPLYAWRVPSTNGSTERYYFSSSLRTGIYHIEVEVTNGGQAVYSIIQQ